MEEDEHVVTAASSVGSGVLQADAAAKQKPAPECLLNSTEAISSSRLYSNGQTHKECRTQRGREKMGKVERRQRKEIPQSTEHCVNKKH